MTSVPFLRDSVILFLHPLLPPPSKGLILTGKTGLGIYSSNVGFRRLTAGVEWMHWTRGPTFKALEIPWSRVLNKIVHVTSLKGRIFTQRGWLTLSLKETKPQPSTQTQAVVTLWLRGRNSPSHVRINLFMPIHSPCHPQGLLGKEWKRNQTDHWEGGALEHGRGRWGWTLL